MNCHEFELLAGDLSKDKLMDANLRKTGLEHSASCADCAGRLENERDLTTALREIAIASTEQAPPRIEAAVRAAFRQQRSEVPAASAWFVGRRRVYAAAGIAAMLVIVALVALAISRNSQSNQSNANQQAVGVAPETRGGSSEPSGKEVIPPQISPKKAIAQRRKPKLDHREHREEAPEDLGHNATVEIATDFIPLTNRETLAQMDGGQVLRVELPRSALMSFGLPVDMERATERIKADVVVGNDGLARAIRFVH